jgi:hypothetical protein
MPSTARIATASAAIALAALLSACVPSDPGSSVSPEQQGPQPPASALLTLQRLATVVTADDAPAQALFDVGEASTSGSDLASEQQYWDAVGGSPEECRDVVSSPYLVASADAADEAHLDDPTGALARFTEDEDLFGLIQVYGRIFDDETAAAAYLDGLVQTVAGCAGYQLVGEDGAVTYQAVALRLLESTTAPIGTRVVDLREDVAGSDIVGVGTTFVLRKNAVIAIYSELYPRSTMTTADVTELAGTLADRLAAL